MKTVICNSLQSFWDMADNHLLEGLHVHCVFEIDEQSKADLINNRSRYDIQSISFSSVKHTLSL
ncbi:hypothetical protein ACFODT_00360 [Vibrio zhugei]|uniref:Exonuclease V subunit gamma n=1 Tax=Vibrio zhugei TaxID=2479546 RepID=A0ABV7C2P9_9VIBR|nr:hypothetical protein [Vibrio zhugei]